jgi:hypothetical protein
VLLCWTLYHSFLSPVPTVLLSIFSPNSYLSPGPHYGGEARVCAVGTDRVTDKSLEKKLREVLSAHPNLGHSLLKCPMAPHWKHPCLSPFLGDGLGDCALYLSIRLWSQRSKRGGEVDMEEKNQQDRLLGVNRELGDHPEGRVKF